MKSLWISNYPYIQKWYCYSGLLIFLKHYTYICLREHATVYKGNFLIWTCLIIIFLTYVELRANFHNKKKSENIYREKNKEIKSTKKYNKNEEFL